MRAGGARCARCAGAARTTATRATGPTPATVATPRRWRMPVAPRRIRIGDEINRLCRFLLIVIGVQIRVLARPQVAALGIVVPATPAPPGEGFASRADREVVDVLGV